jgi:mRNA interferase RelE/StbE
VAFRVEFTRKAEKQIRKLDRQVRDRVDSAIDGLAENPRPANYKPLKGSPYARIRVGDYRVIYEVRDREVLVLVLEVGHRRDVYD